MARSTWKGFFLSKPIYFSIFNSFFFKHRRWVIISRSSAIPKIFAHSICSIHNGLSCKQLWLRRIYIGRKFGEFAFTRKNYHFMPKEKKNKTTSLMGQISSPLSMRFSKSMQWPSLWNDKLNFTKKVKVDVLITTILPLFFNEAVYLNKYTNNKSLSFYLNSCLKNNFSSLSSFYETFFFKKKLAFNSLETLTPFFLSFFGKVWVIRFNKWVIIVFFVYSPKKIKFFKKLKHKNTNLRNYMVWKLSSTNSLLRDIKRCSDFFYF